MAKPVTAKWDRSKGRPEPISALNRIQEVECHEPLVSLAEVAPSAIMLRPQVIPYLRKTVAEMLEAACASLPPGMHLGVIDAWRPFARQVRIYDMMVNFAHEVWPNMSYSQVRRRVCRFVAPVDQKAPPGHCTGAAVDVWLVDERGKSIDVCSPFDRFTAAPTYAYGLTPEALHNRSILVDSMLAAGFSNCRDEWWHYSFGDAGFAVRVGEPACRYGLIELPLEAYAEQENIWIEANKNRPNPFLGHSP